MSITLLSIIPTRAISDVSLGDASLRTLLAIASHCDSTRTCYPSVARLSRILNKQDRTVRRDMSLLVKLGYIQKITQFRNGMQIQNKYKVIFDDELLGDDAQRQGGGDAQRQGGGDTQRQGGGDTQRQGGGDTQRQGGGDAQRQAEQTIITINKKKDDFIKSVVDKMGSDEYTLEQAEACHDYWSANDEFPKGDALAKFRGWLRNAKKLGVKKGSAKVERGLVGESEETSKWRMRIKKFKQNGFWLANWGKNPDDDKCDAPKWLINEVYGQGRFVSL